MNAPKEIKIKSDDNILILVEVDKLGNCTYKYSKSKTKKGQMLTLSEEQLTKILKQNE